MTLFERIRRLLRANLNDLIERAEDPEKVIKQLLLDLTSHLADARGQVAVAVAEEKRLIARYQAAKRQADEWRRKAELAVDYGKDDMAREALARQGSEARVAAEIDHRRRRASVVAQSMNDEYAALHAKIEEVKAVIARSRRARTSAQIQQTLSRLKQGEALSAFDYMERRAEEDEARASAYAELNGDRLDERFAALERESELDRHLADLKAQRTQRTLFDVLRVDPTDVDQAPAPEYEDIERELMRLKTRSDRAFPLR